MREYLLWAMLCLVPMTAFAQPPKPRATVGAYYFDGWSGEGEHISKLLQTKYADRKPLWGWKDDTTEIMQKQIDYCADHGIAFWAFDWYYPEGENKTTPLNNALDLYLKAPNRQRLQFCLLVANHSGFRIGPKDWDACCQRWIELFKQPTHLQVGGLPLLVFFAHDELRKAFGGVEGVHQAFESLRTKAKEAGLPGVAVAACTGPQGNLDDFVRSGYTLLTGYNYALGWLNGGKEEPFQKLMDGSDAFSISSPQKRRCPMSRSLRSDGIVARGKKTRSRPTRCHRGIPTARPSRSRTLYGWASAGWRSIPTRPRPNGSC